MLLGLIVAIHSQEGPIRACHLALMTKQTTENRPTENRPARLDWVRPGLDQVDSPVDRPVDLVRPGRQPSRPRCLRREFSRLGQLGPVFIFKLFYSVRILNLIQKLPKAISSSYGLRFSKTRTLFRVFFRDERNGVLRFP